jgi:hypothetical protein
MTVRHSRAARQQAPPLTSSTSVAPGEIRYPRRASYGRGGWSSSLKAVAEVALEVMSSIGEGARVTASGADNRDGSDVSAVATGSSGQPPHHATGRPHRLETR